MSHESTLQASFLLVQPLELPSLRFFRRNIGEAKLRGGYTVKFGIAGQFDFYAIQTGGLHIEVELKSSTGTLRPAQREWRDFCIAWKIPFVILKGRHEESVDDTVKRWIEEMRELLSRHSSGSQALST